jgi:hypothetical protein
MTGGKQEPSFQRILPGYFWDSTDTGANDRLRRPISGAMQARPPPKSAVPPRNLDSSGRSNGAQDSAATLYCHT